MRTMSLFSWLFPAGKPAKAQAESSGLSRIEPTRPAGKRAAGNALPAGNAQPANRKSERMARRELLYAVVREAMMRAGVLSASYKFKVLSLDPRGRQFLVMVDLARENGGETQRLAEIEALIAQAAKSRYDIVVTAVYWRTNEHVAVGDPRGQPQQRANDSQPVPLESLPVAPAAARAPLAPAAGPQPCAGFEPILPDEVAAFKRALAVGAAIPHGANAKAFNGAAKRGPQSYTLLTGFEDTEMPEADRRVPALSSTQYGELA
jgi:hypothetical protein